MNLTLNPFTLSAEMVKMGDPRTRDYPLVTNPLFIFPLLFFYLYFVKVAGPRWMENRKPFEIINVVRVYNLLMVAVSVWFLSAILPFTYLPGGHYSLWCQGITGYMTEEMRRYYKIGWIFVASRYADLFDTVFFVLRKKFTHVSNLHVIHHTLVTVNVWFYTLFAPEGQPAFGLALNVFVHTIMYSYYFLTTFGPRVRKYLWWKKYLTTVQIVQFVIMILHFSVPLFVDCSFPRHLIIIGNAQTFLVLCLFINFYVKNYTIRASEKSIKRS
ncbi:hypothetical protein HPB48_005589 [Haemaphysalis longicornis]|uniref:Elongation of very long chain fatty acids protein n=1 Tax=Haemaphysalis longicornis TaxID=44386 RepID=A0A9J6GFT0_HAELO|nr:hypothetical protein HPB48_005589 [Haemaphysalis longicornis]